MNEYRSYDWRVSWTEGGKDFCERGFHSFKKTQEFALNRVKAEGDADGFAIYVERMMIVNLTSFLNAETAGAVELAPHLLGTADTFA